MPAMSPFKFLFSADYRSNMLRSNSDGRLEIRIGRVYRRLILYAVEIIAGTYAFVHLIPTLTDFEKAKTNDLILDLSIIVIGILIENGARNSEFYQDVGERLNGLDERINHIEETIDKENTGVEHVQRSLSELYSILKVSQPVQHLHSSDSLFHPIFTALLDATSKGKTNNVSSLLTHRVNQVVVRLRQELEDLAEGRLSLPDKNWAVADRELMLGSSSKGDFISFCQYNRIWLQPKGREIWKIQKALAAERKFRRIFVLSDEEVNNDALFADLLVVMAEQERCGVAVGYIRLEEAGIRLEDIAIYDDSICSWTDLYGKAGGVDGIRLVWNTAEVGKFIDMFENAMQFAISLSDLHETVARKTNQEPLSGIKTAPS